MSLGCANAMFDLCTYFTDIAFEIQGCLRQNSFVDGSIAISFLVWSYPIQSVPFDLQNVKLKFNPISYQIYPPKILRQIIAKRTRIFNGWSLYRRGRGQNKVCRWRFFGMIPCQVHTFTQHTHMELDTWPKQLSGKNMWRILGRCSLVVYWTNFWCNFLLNVTCQKGRLWIDL